MHGKTTHGKCQDWAYLVKVKGRANVYNHKQALKAQEALLKNFKSFLIVRVRFWH